MRFVLLVDFKYQDMLSDFRSSLGVQVTTNSHDLAQHSKPYALVVMKADCGCATQICDMFLNL